MMVPDGLVAATSRQLTRRTVAWGGGLLIAVIVAMAAFDIVRSYRTAVEATGRELETQARIVAEQMGRSVQGVDVVLRHIAAEFNRGRLSKLTPAELHAYLSEQAVGLVQIDGIAMHDAKGDAVALSWLPVGTQVNIAHFEGFPAVRDDPKAGLFVSAATRSPTDQRWVYPLLRRLETPSGEFAGCRQRGAHRLPPAVLSRRLISTRAKITLMHRNRTLLARDPPVGGIGQHFRCSKRCSRSVQRGSRRRRERSVRSTVSNASVRYGRFRTTRWRFLSPATRTPRSHRGGKWRGAPRPARWRWPHSRPR
jgi:hypothetical protein